LFFISSQVTMATRSTRSKQNAKQKQQGQQGPQISDQLREELLTKISIHRGSITDLHVDCVVNAANDGLWAGAGVCGAIFSAAGYGKLTTECDSIISKYGRVPTGDSVLTKGYNLYAKHIIHSVGPMGQNNQALQSCYRTALDLCILHNIRSIAFPCISTGVFGFSKQVAAPVALRAVRDYLLSAKNIKYKDYVKLLREKQQTKDKLATANRKKKSKYSSYRYDDSDDDQDDDLNAWDDDDDKDKKNEKQAKEDKKGEDDKKGEADKANGAEAVKEQKEDDKASNEKEAVKQQEKEKPVEEQKKNENAKESEPANEANEEGKDEVDKQNDTELEKKEIEKAKKEEEEDAETVFDRLDHIVFCCFDYGNWDLYEEWTPKVFPALNKDYSYYWRDKVNANKKKKKQANYEKNQGKNGGNKQKGNAQKKVAVQAKTAMDMDSQGSENDD